jgi:autotransporter family porin
MALDLGKRGLLSPDDILVFGVLGGFVNGNLDYDSISRAFDFEGGQVGGYATYLRGGLFVDTWSTCISSTSTPTRPWASPARSTPPRWASEQILAIASARSMAGHSSEPLATIAVNWAEIDGFSLGGNKVSFGDDPDGKIRPPRRHQHAGMDRHHHGAVRDRQPVGQSLRRQ